MKTYLTKNGLLVVRDDASFFTSNDGTFRRIATADEVEYLIDEVGLERIEFKSEVLAASLYKLEVPLWHYLWSIPNDDYSSYKSGTCNNAQMEKEAEQLTAAAKAAYYIEEAIKAFEGKEREAFAVIDDIRCAMSEGKEIEAQYEEGFPAQM